MIKFYILSQSVLRFNDDTIYVINTSENKIVVFCLFYASNKNLVLVIT